MEAVAADIPQHWRLLPDVFAQHVSRGTWKLYGYLRFLALEVACAIARGGEQILISLPVRHGKSTFISHWLVLWFLSWFPEHNVLLASYEAELAEHWGRLARNRVLEAPEMLIELSGDSTAAGRWNTRQGGGLATVGVGGPITGRGGKLLLVDDPVKNAEEADSETMREKLKDWWQSTWATRAEPGATKIVMMARWHEDDLYGWLREQGGWREIRLPALAEDNDPLGRRPGDALCPERYDRESLLALQSDHGVGQRWFNALFQQAPSSAEGNEIRREWWKWYDELPVLPREMDAVFHTWDCTLEPNATSDYVVGQAWGIYGPRRYMLDSFRAKADFVDTITAMREMIAKWPPHGVLIEKAVNGRAAIHTLQREFGGVIPVVAHGSKITRARAVVPQIAGGNVYLPKNKAWAVDLVDEAAAFPRGKHDDQVDALSQFLDYAQHFQVEHRSDLTPSDDRFVPPDILKEQRYAGLGALRPQMKKWLG